MPERNLGAVLAFWLAFAGPLEAGGFPPITEAQRVLTEVDWDRSARAVVLEKKGEFWMLDESRNRFSSRLLVTTRIKVLAGGPEQDLGEVEVLHSEDHRLHELAGRTVRPDGTVLELGEDAVFERTLSENQGVQVTTLVFPAVEVGAILDYSYEVRFDSIWFLEPWYFQDRYPVELSQITLHVPSNIATVSWGHNTTGAAMEHETTKEPGGAAVRAWMRRLPAVPREDFGYPFEDMSSRFMMLPAYLVESGQQVNLLQDWSTTCSIVDDYIYSPYWARARKAKARVRELVAGAAGAADKIEAIFAFVRDEIDSLGWSGIAPYRQNVDEVLVEGSGSSADKTLTLYKLLELAGVESDIVWIVDRAEGRIDPQVANPGWFDRPVLRATVEGKATFLDPASPAGPGYLPAGAQGMPALLFHQRNPSVIEIPPGAATDNRRNAVLRLRVTDEGGLEGTASLEFTGHHAAAVIGLGDSVEEVRERWREWLADELAGFEFSDIETMQEPSGPRVMVRFALQLALTEILGDEIAWKPSRPLGPVNQAFEAENDRRTPVLFSFADLDQVTVRLEVPEPWRLDATPAPVEFSNLAGSLTAASTTDGGRGVTYERRLVISEREFAGRVQYQAIRALFAEAAKHDAQEMVLIRP